MLFISGDRLTGLDGKQRKQAKIERGRIRTREARWLYPWVRRLIARTNDKRGQISFHKLVLNKIDQMNKVKSAQESEIP